MTADATRVRERRLRAQGLALPTDRTPTEAVRRLAAVQSQEPGHAFWSLALRSHATTEAEVRAAYDAGEFLRTHVLRPTWHFAAAEDVRWLLATTAARVQQANGSMLRKRGLGTAELDRGARVLADALAGGDVLARPEVVTVLADAGLPCEQLDVVLLVMHAELEQVVVSGPMRGATHTYALLDDRVPRGPADGPDPVRLLRRYLAGHGPASVRDVARWSSLTLTTVRTAIAELRDELVTVEVAGETYHSLPPGPDVGDLPPVLLLPLFDELPLGYRDLAFPPAPGHPHPPDVDLRSGSVFAGDANVGTWRREVRGRAVEVALALAPGVPDDVRALAHGEAVRLARFLDRDLDLR
ncbi:winged helix DNA-binding domain-containing protein [Microlunatus spumicola]|uniref:Winged helix DNA-binding domain-containing protein n=1 Tax=Microlunatus spumicola TaxID=81499 RepID=A0ABP6WTU9_9ACTN